jgi:hypothetical protein
MEAKDLVDNIRADFITEIVPFFRISPTSPTQAKFLVNVLQSSAPLLSAETLFTCATILERDSIEYCLRNCFRHQATFQSRLIIRIASASAARALTEVIFKGNRGV